MIDPVLIVGAGPTGLMLANQLVRRGVRPLIIDRNAGPSIQTKALGVQARTLEIYAHLGIAERAIELGARGTGAHIWVAGRRAARVPFGETGQALSPYPFLLILGQDDNERLLGEVLRSRGVEVQWNAELVDLARHADHATATLRRADGSTQEVRARWIAGCDGARSAVRTLSGVAFVGAPYEHVFFVADTQVDGPMVPGELNVYLWRGGFYLFFPMRGPEHWRVVGILPPALRGRDDVTFDDVLPAIGGETGARLSFQTCRWFSTYRIHHRRAGRFRAGRCFLLGDAAHIHSPVGAQGMNTGLQDAYNLAWKLALVVSGRAAPDLLDSYGAEREPVADQLLQTTDRGFSFVVSDRWMAGVFRMRVLARVLAFAMRQERMRTLAFRTISQIGIRYPASPLTQTLTDLPRGGVRAGDRFPWLVLPPAAGAPAKDLFSRLDDTRFNLIVVGHTPTPDDVAALDDLVAMHPVAANPGNREALARAGIPTPSFYLVRPDGYIGLAGARLRRESLTTYLADNLRLSATTSPAGI